MRWWAIPALLVVALGVAWWQPLRRPVPAITSFAACSTAGYAVRDTDPPSCSDGHHTWLGPRAAATASGTPVASVPFELLVDGDSHSRYPREQRLITTGRDWIGYWSAIHAGLSSLPPLLPVDFARSDVVAMSDGQRPTGGYSLRVNAVTASPAGTIVDVTESVPTSSCVVTQAVTNRYLLVRTTGKLTEPVSFRVATEPRHC